MKMLMRREDIILECWGVMVNMKVRFRKTVDMLQGTETAIPWSKAKPKLLIQSYTMLLQIRLQ
jgi:hypothetical protein